MVRVLSVLISVAVLGSAFFIVDRTLPSWYARFRYPLEYEHILRGHAENYELDAALLAAVIYSESKFDPDAESSAGAIGLMQILPNTAEGIALNTGGAEFVIEDLYDPEINVRYGAFYLRRLLDRYDDLEVALAAYNAGQTNVDDWLSAGGEIQFPETREYVEQVMDVREIYERAYRDRLGL